MIKIYGSHKSSSRRCFWCLEEAGLKYEAVPVDMRAKEHKAEAYLKINPNGKVPSLVDGEVTVWESMAINFYLGDCYKQDLIGHTVSERAPVRQWSFWALAEMQPSLVDSLIQLVFVPEERRDLERVEKNMEKIAPQLQTLEASLTRSSYLVANRFTLADLNVASVIEIHQLIDKPLKNYPKIESWLAKLQERPAYLRLKELDEEK